MNHSTFDAVGGPKLDVLSPPSVGVESARPQILDAVRDGLGIDEALCRTSREVLAEHGNMSSPTILHILDRMIHRDAPRPWGVLAFGPGLAAEGLLIR